jgi:signal transduction histidine kinase
VQKPAPIAVTRATTKKTNPRNTKTISPSVQSTAVGSMNRGYSSRSGRSTQNISTGNWNTDVFQDNNVAVQAGSLDIQQQEQQRAEVVPQQASPPAQQALPAVPQQALPPVQDPAEFAQVAQAPEPIAEPLAQLVPARRTNWRTESVVRQEDNGLGREADRDDVMVTPLSGQRVGDALVLSRTVVVRGETYRQGFALDLDALADTLEQQVVGQTELAPYLSLGWNDDPLPVERDWNFEHRFAEPFGGLSATLSLSPVPGVARSDRGVLMVLVTLLGLAGMIGVVAVWRMVSTEVEFAQRRNDFVAAVSHELKTPLTSIRMYSEMLRDGLVLSDDRRQVYYETMTAESERLSRLIDNVLELGRLERGTSQRGTVVGAIGPVLERIPAVLGTHARDRGFALEVEVDEGLPSVAVEPDALLQVLVNLVDNAIKFSANSETKVVTIRAVRHGDGVRLEIRDRGPGVPPRQLKRIFQPFFRGERELTRTTKGTGIGLSLVKGLIERMGGSVAARNHPDGGFEIAIQLLA